MQTAPKHVSDVHTITVDIVNFSNTTFNVMWVTHLLNGTNSRTNKWMPAMIKVDDEHLQKTVKEILQNPNGNLRRVIMVERGIDGNGSICARLIGIQGYDNRI